MTPDSSRPPLDPVNNSRQPFGLPAGTVRGFLSLLICAFFWMVLLWPSDAVAKPLLGHFFMLALVLMAFASSPTAHSGYRDTSLAPWLMRTLFVGGSIAVVAFTLVKDPAQFSQRLTPDVVEFREWWGTFLAVTAGGFAFGLFIRFVLGRENPVFLTMRAWLSVVGMVMLALELGLFVAFMSAESKPDTFMRYWQTIEVAAVAAYFGTRA
jgi:hypothetical protein